MQQNCLFLHKKGSAYALLRNVSVDKMKMLLPAVITAHYVLKNAAKETVFAGNRLVLRAPFDMRIRKDAICSVISARSVDERRLILQEIEAPCRARCHQHFCAIAHKAPDTPVHTLGKSYVGCVDNMLLIILLTAMSVLIRFVRRLLVIMLLIPLVQPGSS